MSSVANTQALLIEREEEIRAYVAFLKVAVERPAFVIANDGQLQFPLSLDLTHTFKSSLVLLLYSAMEATLVQLLDDMHDAFGTHCDSADSLNSALLKLVLQTFRNAKDGRVLQSESPLHRSLFTHWINDWQSRTSGKEKRGDGISGSVDGVIFYEQLTKFGVIAPTANGRPPRHLTHYTLQQIKNNRNALAHGEKSFTDLGRDLAVETLEGDVDHVFRTLNQIATEVNSYLQERRFLAPPPAAAAEPAPQPTG